MEILLLIEGISIVITFLPPSSYVCAESAGLFYFLRVARATCTHVLKSSLGRQGKEDPISVKREGATRLLYCLSIPQPCLHADQCVFLFLLLCTSTTALALRFMLAGVKIDKCRKGDDSVDNLGLSVFLWGGGRSQAKNCIFFSL